MVHKTIAAIGLVSTCVVLASAQIIKAQSEHKKWGDSGAWVILVDPDVGNGCYMENTFEEGTLVQVGFVPDRKGGFFAAYNSAWTNIEDGTVGTIQFDFGKSLFGGDYVGVVKADRFGGYAFFNNPEFVREFGKRNTVSIKGDKGNALDFSLKGTTKAINAVRSCDAEQPKR
jgi:hypothetical protein